MKELLITVDSCNEEELGRPIAHFTTVLLLIPSAPPTHASVWLLSAARRIYLDCNISSQFNTASVCNCSSARMFWRHCDPTDGEEISRKIVLLKTVRKREAFNKTP